MSGTSFVCGGYLGKGGRPDPINTQPSSPGAFNDNPASGPAMPPKATDRSPSPSGNGGGKTQVTTPSGTEKVR